MTAEQSSGTQVPEGLYYTAQHEWLRLEHVPGGEHAEGTVGITDYAQSELGDVVFVQLPAVGTEVMQGDAFGEVESVKTVSDLHSPATGEVLAVNNALAEQPELVNSSPYEEGWMIRIRLADRAEVDALLDADAYRGRLPDGGS